MDWFCGYFKDRYKWAFKLENKYRKLGRLSDCQKWINRLFDVKWAVKTLDICDLSDKVKIGYLQTYTRMGLQGLDRHGKNIIAEIINSAPRTTRDMVLYRGLSKEFDEPYDHNYHKEKFVSMTFLQNIAASFATRYTGEVMGRDYVDEGFYILELTIPKGTRCLFVDALLPQIFDWPEGEIIIPTFDVEIVSEQKKTLKYKDFRKDAVETAAFTILKANAVVKTAINPKTGRKIRKDGATYARLRRERCLK